MFSVIKHYIPEGSFFNAFLKCIATALRYTLEQQEALVSNVFLTGGNMHYSGMKERVERELLAMRPFQSQFKVRQQHDFHPNVCSELKKMTDAFQMHQCCYIDACSNIYRLILNAEIKKLK